MKRFPLTGLLFGGILVALVTLLPSSARANDDFIPLDTLRRGAEALTPAAVAFLSRTIQYKSVENFGHELKPDTWDMLQYIFSEARKIGFATRLAADGLVGVLEYGAGAETVGVLIQIGRASCRERVLCVV